MQKTIQILVVSILVLSHFNTNTSHIWFSAAYYLSIAALFILVFILCIRKSISLNFPEIVIFIFALYLAINNVINSTFTGNHHLHDFLIPLILYFPISWLYKTNKGISQTIIYGLITGCTLEVIMSFGQWFGFFQNASSHFIIGGFFSNPGAFAGYLSVITVFFTGYLLLNKKERIHENLQLFLTGLIGCSLCLILLCNSRGAWLALLCGILYIVNYKYSIVTRLKAHLKSTMAKVTTLSAIIILAVSLLFALYQYKAESAFGRLFIWKLSKEMIVEKPLFGLGHGTFAADYGKVQANYFLTNKASEKEIMVADYVTCAYNEFLELLTESGIIGLLLFLGILFFAFHKSDNELRPHNKIIAKAGLLALLVVSNVSYPFNYSANLLPLTIFLVIIFHNSRFKPVLISNYAKAIAITCTLLALLLVFMNMKYLAGTFHLHNGYQYVLQENYDTGLKHYKKANQYLKNNGEFLFYYGSAFYLNEEYQASIPYLKQACLLRSDPHAHIILGQSLQKLGRYKEAEQAFKIASGITPSKMYPKYLLAIMYNESKQYDKATQMAKRIIDMKEKVPTTAGKEIKTEMKNLLYK